MLRMMLSVTVTGITTFMVLCSLFVTANALPGKFKLFVVVRSFSNPNRLTQNGVCCDGSCDNVDYCEYYFTVCLQEYDSTSNSFFSTGSCPYGRKSSAVVSEDADEFASDSDSQFLFPNGGSNIIALEGSYWPGQIRLGFRAWDKDGDIGGDDDDVIGTVFVSLDRTDLFPGDALTTPKMYSTSKMQVELSFRVQCAGNYYGPYCLILCSSLSVNFACNRNGQRVCAENYYGDSCEISCIPMGNILCNENGQQVCTENYYGSSCTVFCKDSDNATGHYYCDDDGNRVCLDGYQNPSTNCVDCVPAEGCYLDPCSHRQPCQNGATCINIGPDMYQCVCTEEYEGENCTLRVTVCEPNPCQNGGVCNVLVGGYNCTCSDGFNQLNCNVSTLPETSAIPIWAVIGAGVAGGLVLVGVLLVLLVALCVFLLRRGRKTPIPADVDHIYDVPMMSTALELNARISCDTEDRIYDNDNVIPARPNQAYGTITAEARQNYDPCGQCRQEESCSKKM